MSREADEDIQAALAASLEDVKDSAVETSKEVGTVKDGEKTCSSSKPEFPPLPEEPKVDRNLLCRVAVRLPDGHRAQRSFLRTDPIQVTVACDRHKVPHHQQSEILLWFPLLGAYFPSILIAFFCSYCGHSAMHS